MSRRAGYPVFVVEDENGTPRDIRRADGERYLLSRPAPSRAVLPILRVLAYHREWIGVLDGEPERDVWLVETPDGICELHRLRDPARAAAEGRSHLPLGTKDQTDTIIASPLPPDRWMLARWED